MLRLLTRPSSTLVRKNLLNPPTFTLTRTMSSANPSVRSNDELKASNLFNVSNLNAVVTGGGTGIGLMITQALASNGAKVYITGRRKDALNKVVEQYGGGPGKIVALPGDISSKDEVKRLMNEVAKKESKGIHLLVNNAGIARDDNTGFSKAGKPDSTSAQAISDHLMQSEPEQWAETLQTNLTAQFFMTAAFLPLLAKGRDVTPGYTSSVVNTASISGVMKESSSGQFAYATSKAGPCSPLPYPEGYKHPQKIPTNHRLHPPNPNDGHNLRQRQDPRQLYRPRHLPQRNDSRLLRRRSEIKAGYEHVESSWTDWPRFRYGGLHIVPCWAGGPVLECAGFISGRR